VRRGSIEELAKAMAEWARKPRLGMDERWKLHGWVAERFSLERAAKDLAELYGELTAKNA
jgi:glycosyltransferase involved in cell wall biosynthesis